jgi:ribose transport system substrate-binding protein
MKKTVSIMLAVLLMLCFILAGCTSSGPGSSEDEAPASGDGGGEKFTVGFSVITLEFTYYAEMKDAIESICKERDWDCITSVAGQDVEATLNDCADLIQKGVDALVIASWYGDSMGEVYELATAADIPVYFIDTGGLDPSAPYITHVVADDKETGYAFGIWIADYFKQQGKTEIDYAVITTATSVGRNRADGFIEGLAAGGVTGNNLNEHNFTAREDAMNFTEDTLVANSKLDLIYTIAEMAMLGAYDACAAANRDEVTIVGWDSGQEQQQLVDSGTQILGYVSLDPALEAKLTLDAVQAYRDGESVDKLITYYPSIYTKDGLISLEDVMK